MSNKNQVSRKEVVNFLLAESDREERMIVLLPNSKKIREVNNAIASEIRESTNYAFDKTTAFSVTNSMIRHANKKVFLGLNKDAELLEGEYSLEEIKTYGENE